MRIDYTIGEVRPYIHWAYFLHAWGLAGRRQTATEDFGQERDRLLRDAEAMLDGLGDRYATHAVFRLFEARSEDDDLLLNSRDCLPENDSWVRLPLLRQQHCVPSLCLADFVSPAKDTVGVFAATVDADVVDGEQDDYRRLLAQTLADRLAEATAERLHEQVRREWWGYAPDERLTIDDLHQERFQGIRPAVGYPSLPDMSLNFLLDQLLNMGQIGIRLTESGMMQPHASVSGLMLAHPEARYFDVGPVGEDQLQDYARRRGLSVGQVRKFLMKR